MPDALVLDLHIQSHGGRHQGAFLRSVIMAGRLGAFHPGRVPDRLAGLPLVTAFTLSTALSAARMGLSHAVMLRLGEGRARMTMPLLPGCELDAAFGLETKLMKSAFEDADVPLEKIERMAVFRADQGVHAPAVMDFEGDLDAAQLRWIQAQGEFRLLAADAILEGEAELDGRMRLLLGGCRLLEADE